MKKIKVLFVCVHNAARSQMAESYLNEMGKDFVLAESAGLEKGELNPLAVEVMSEEGIDISGNTTDDVFDFFKEGRLYNYVITVCDEAAAQRCPIFPGITTTINWSFEDPAKFTGTKEERLKQTRRVRDSIKKNVETLLQEIKEVHKI